MNVRQQYELEITGGEEMIEGEIEMTAIYEPGGGEDTPSASELAFNITQEDSVSFEPWESGYGLKPGALVNLGDLDAIVWEVKKLEKTVTVIILDGPSARVTHVVSFFL